MPAKTYSAATCSAWNPGIGPGVPSELRSLETIFCPAWVFSSLGPVGEFAKLTGLPNEELTVFKPERLALHELIIRVTADITVAEGKEQEAFGRNFRQIVWKIRDDYIGSQMETIKHSYASLSQRADTVVRKTLAETLYQLPASPTPRRFPLSWFGKTKNPAASLESVQEREYRIISEYKATGLSTDDPLQRAVFKSLYRVLGAIAAMHGSVGSDQDLLTKLVCQHVCNNYGSHLIGQEIAPIVEAAIEKEGYTRIPNREVPILISLKGASAAGKSSLRQMLKQVMREHGIEPDSYTTISPDIWRRLLLDYESLGTAYKYASYLTSRELMVIDSKLDRYIRFKANRDQAIPHFLIDRFRFDSFSSDKVERILHNTYAKYVNTMYMYFVVTPPEETVERGWQRALERGRYKAVEDFLGHCVESYSGMPKILFKWLTYRQPKYRYYFLDNSVPKGTLPKTIAFGTQDEITIYDPVAIINIERYQKINIYANSPAEVYPAAPAMTIERNSKFLKECIGEISVVNFVDRASGITYGRVQKGTFEVLDAPTLSRILNDEETSAVFSEIAPLLIQD